MIAFDWQTAAVIVLAVCAAAYTLRSFLRQFQRADDEAGGCSACPAAGRDARKPRRG